MSNRKLSPFHIVIAVIVVVMFYVIFISGRDELQPMSDSNGFKIKTWETDNGAKVMYVHAPELPMVDVRVVFNAGSARDDDLAGVANMTSLLLDHGAAKWDTNEIVERFDEIGAQFSTSSYRDMAVIKLRTLTDKEYLESALETAAAIIQKPHFDKDELERERQRVLVALQNQQESPGDIASLAFFEAVYGDHPYASPSLGTPESVKRIDRDDLKDFYEKYYVAKNALVVIVGAVDRDEAQEIAEKLIDRLPKGKAAPALPRVSELDSAKRIIRDYPSAQTHILVGQPGMKRGDKDYFALYVGNHILGGGGFGSRIMDQIREKNGLAYSAYSYFSPMQADGPFIMGLQTKNVQAQQAYDMLMNIINEFIEKGPTEQELIDTKLNITGGFALKIDSNKDIAEYVSMIGFYDLPLDYLETFNSKIEAVTIDQIKSAFRRRIHPDKMVTIMVGGKTE
jgi:zinc protease